MGVQSFVPEFFFFLFLMVNRTTLIFFFIEFVLVFSVQTFVPEFDFIFFIFFILTNSVIVINIYLLQNNNAFFFLSFYLHTYIVRYTTRNSKK